MIKFDKFGIDADSNGYQVGLLGKREVKNKNGIQIEQDCILKPMYCSTVQSALSELLKREQRLLVSKRARPKNRTASVQ
jgi:hypothetical protein